jgi:hypothetical protein
VCGSATDQIEVPVAVNVSEGDCRDTIGFLGAPVRLDAEGAAAIQVEPDGAERAADNEIERPIAVDIA